jgi:hypothetical protein
VGWRQAEHHQHLASRGWLGGSLDPLGWSGEAERAQCHGEQCAPSCAERHRSAWAPNGSAKRTILSARSFCTASPDRAAGTSLDAWVDVGPSTMRPPVLVTTRRNSASVIAGSNIWQSRRPWMPGAQTRQCR